MHINNYNNFVDIKITPHENTLSFFTAALAAAVFAVLLDLASLETSTPLSTTLTVHLTRPAPHFTLQERL